ncbi:MAG: HAD family phosphatase [Elusimicrobia bacterium]|nr:HAD family phosphatase [Candidatus Liberimonas magnetica]
MNKYRAVLFDFDGVIARTMEDNYRAWKVALKGHKVCFSKKEYFLLEGMNVKNVARKLLGKKNNRSGLVDKICKAKDDYYLNNNSFSLYSGVKTLISRLRKKGYKLGLVTGASKVRLVKSAGADFLKRFEAVITGDMVRKPKPDPLPYLLAAKAMSVNPAQCLVVENAPLGIESAKNAGMFCVAVASTLNKKYLKKADIVIDRIQMLEGLL